MVDVVIAKLFNNMIKLEIKQLHNICFYYRFIGFQINDNQ